MSICPLIPYYLAAWPLGSSFLNFLQQLYADSLSWTALKINLPVYPSCPCILLGIAAAGTIVATVAYAAKKPKDRKNKDFCDDYFNYMEEVTEDAE